MPVRGRRVVRELRVGRESIDMGCRHDVLLIYLTLPILSYPILSYPYPYPRNLTLLELLKPNTTSFFIFHLSFFNFFIFSFDFLPYIHTYITST